MVGLPARGKTYISKKLTRYLNWIGVPTKGKACTGFQEVWSSGILLDQCFGRWEVVGDGSKILQAKYLCFHILLQPRFSVTLKAKGCPDLFALRKFLGPSLL